MDTIVIKNQTHHFNKDSIKMNADYSAIVNGLDSIQ